MRFAHVLSRITGTPWLITREALENITALIEARAGGLSAEAAMWRAEMEEKGNSVFAAYETEHTTGVAIIDIHGVIGKRLSAMEMMCGGADIDAVEAAFDAANNDASVKRIVLHVDSPGGTVTGVPELAQKIYETKRKPVVAVSDSLMASAAYYIASAADEIVVTPTANIGSIGAALQVREAVGTVSADGRTRLRVFRSGEDKMAGVDGPLTEAQAKNAQERVDQLGAMFRADVSKARPSVAADSMTGLIFFGEESVSRHLADRVVRNLGEVLSVGG